MRSFHQFEYLGLRVAFNALRPKLQSRFALAAFVALVILGGCTPKIGRECTTSLDCSQQGDRLCDNTQPNGYCTIFNCEPDKCPEGDGICVAFLSEVDPACGATDGVSWGRFERTFCMAGCEIDEDCRAGYECVEPTSRDGRILDFEPLSKRICIVKIAPPPAPTSIPEVCRPPEVEFNLPTYTPGTGGAGGMSGMGGMGGSSGMGGMGGSGGIGGMGGMGGGP